MTNTPQERAGVYGRQSRNKSKSIAEQISAGKSVASENDWFLARTYQDGSSASRYARKGRDDWQRVLDDISGGELDILILWEASRGDRTLTTWSGLLDLCRERGVCLYIIADERLYDPRKARDWKTLATAGVDSAGESDLLSMRVLRGHAGAAAAGRPSHGRTPFGYVRRYNPANGELMGQEPDPDTAPIVREIFKRIAKGDAISNIVHDFNARQVPTSGAEKWYRVRVRDLAMNRAYMGDRIYNGTVSKGTWTPLVEAELFYAAQQVLSDPARVTTRPGRQKHLLTYLGPATPCGGQLTAVRGRYRCIEDGCITIVQEPTDQIVTAAIIGRLSKPDAYEALRLEDSESDRSVLDARNELATLRAQLDDWRRSAIEGKTSPESLAAIEAGLSAKIRDAQRRSEHSGIPPALRQFLDPEVDVAKRWESTPLPARRDIIRTLAEIRISPATVPGGAEYEEARLGMSRWVGDTKTWGEHWAELS